MDAVIFGTDPPPTIQSVHATESSVRPAERARVMAVLFYADWCSACKVLDPKIEAVKRDYVREDILFTRLDMTDDFTQRQSMLLAEQLGLGSLARRHGGRTGFMLLVSSQDGRVLGRLLKSHSEAEIRQAISAALDASGQGT